MALLRQLRRMRLGHAVLVFVIVEALSGLASFMVSESLADAFAAEPFARHLTIMLLAVVVSGALATRATGRGAAGLG